MVGLAEAEEVARLAERDDRELGAAVDEAVPVVGRRTPLREVLPSFLDDSDAPVAVVDEDGRLAGGIVRGSLIAGLTTSTETSSEDGGEDFSGVGTREPSEVGFGEEGGR